MSKIPITTFTLAFVIGFALLISFVTVGLNEPAMAQKADKCAFYENAYISSNKHLSSIWADGIGDDSAPRETNRQLKALNERMEQLIVIQQMQAIGCKLPEQTSSHWHYLSPALDCELERDLESPKCNRDTWTSTTGE